MRDDPGSDEQAGCGMSEDLVFWLGQQLIAEENAALAALSRAPSPWVGMFKQVTSEPAGAPIQTVASTDWAEVSYHIEMWEPQRVLDEVAAKRAVLDRYDLIVKAVKEAGQPSDRYDYRNDYLSNVVRITVHADQRYAQDMVKQVLYAVIVDLAYPYRHMPGWQEAWEV